MPRFVDDSFTNFFKELAGNNNKEWFDNNRKRYLDDVKIVFETIVSDTLNELKKTESLAHIEPKDCIFRINKDVRFSKDKQPYKLQCSASISKGGKKDFVNPGLYFEIGPEFLNIYAGIYGPDKEILESIRRYIYNHIPHFQSVIRENSFKQYFENVKGEKNKVIAKEFKDQITVCPELLNKQFYIFHQQDINCFKNHDVVDYIINVYSKAKPFNLFLSQALS